MSTISGLGGNLGIWTPSRTGDDIQKSFGKLSSGKRINHASDDAAGMAIVSMLSAQVASLGQSSRNAADGSSLVDTADGALGQTSDLLTRARELAMQASSAGVSPEGRDSIQQELSGVMGEIDRISGATEFNGTKLLDGSATTLGFQVGTNGTPQDQIAVTTGDATVNGLGVGGLDLSTAGGAQDALGRIDSAISNLSSMRANFGAISNRLDSAAQTIATSFQNLSAANGRLEDVDVAAESSRLTGLLIQNRASVAVQAQRNQAQGSVLRLLG